MTVPAKSAPSGSLFIRHWFLIALGVAIVAGFASGRSAMLGPDRWPQGVQLADKAAQLVIFGILYCMAVTLDATKLRAAIRAPRPVVWASVVNLLLIPLAAWPLVKLLRSPDLATGLAIAASVPCTMAAASVWARKAGGNDAVSLLTTVLTNGATFLVAPFWLSVIIDSRVPLNEQKLMEALLVSALLPIALGQATRWVSAWKRRADHWKAELSNLAQILILLTVLWSTYKAGPQLRDAAVAVSSTGSAGLKAGTPTDVGQLIVEQPRARDYLLVWGSTAGLHLLALWVGLRGGRRLGLSPEDTVAAALAGSQKTLPVGMLLVGEVARQTGQHFLALPMIMFHASQLVLDTLLLERIKRLADMPEPQSRDAQTPDAH